MSEADREKAINAEIAAIEKENNEGFTWEKESTNANVRARNNTLSV